MRQRVDTWVLGWERNALPTVIARASSSMFTEMGTVSFLRLRALLSTFLILRLGDGAVLVVRMNGTVSGPVVLPE